MHSNSIVLLYNSEDSVIFYAIYVTYIQYFDDNVCIYIYIIYVSTMRTYFRIFSYAL
jgi:hypothetical protein